MSTPCTNCKDSILNKTPTLIGSPLCNGDCPEEYVCLDITPAGCVSIQGKEDCITNGDTVQEQIDNIREYVCDLPTTLNCDCQPNTYTINSVCIYGENEYFILNVTPNFSYLYPLVLFSTIETTIQTPTNIPIGIFYSSVQSTTSGIPLPVSIFRVEGLSFNPNDILTFKVLDNKGNYSQDFTITFSDIQNCP